MTSLLSGAAARFDALAPRERRLVAVAAIGGALLIGWTMIIDPSLARSRIAERAIAEQRSQLAALQAQTLVLQSPGRNPEMLAAAELAELKKQLNALNERFAALEGELVAPERMAGLLEDLLGHQGGPRLLSLRTLPVAPVLEKKDGAEGGTGSSVAASVSASASAKAAPVAGLFKHGVEIKLEGGYAELADYLARLEKSPQKLLWSSVSLSAEKHPRLVLTLTVFTLSLDRTWLIV
jgi:MSHA biogenesis protein MshJ